MTNNTDKQLLLAAISVITIASLSFANVAYANHGTGSGAWTHDGVDYDCLSSLDNLSFETGSGCSDLSVSVWNNISSSDLDFDEVSSNQHMTVGAENLASGWAVNTVTLSGGDITNSEIEFNTDHKWGDRAGADWWKWWVKDYKSTAIHEFGHSVRMVHDANSTLMKATHGTGDIYRTPSSHDISTVQGKY